MLEGDLAAGRLQSALDQYTGELLQGFHVAEAPEFERWLDAERRRLHDAVFHAAVSLADSCRASGDVSGALSAARRAMALAPYDEVSLRRLMEILSAAGDRAGALREYDRVATRAQHEYGFHPSAATTQLVTSLRARPSAPKHRPEVVPANDAAEPVIDTGWRGRKRVMPTVFLTFAVIALGILGWRSQSDARYRSLSPSRVPKAYGAQLGSLLPEAYRGDTALARKYLTAEADLDFVRFKSARESFQQIVDAAPLYAPAWAGLSFALFQSSFGEIPPSTALPRAVAAANRALALDSTLVEAQRTLIANAMFGRWDLADAKRRLDAALTRYPDDPELNNLLATWHRWRGEHDAAIRLKRNAVAIDPLSPRYAHQIGSSLYFAHRCAEAVDVFRRIPEEQRKQLNQSLMFYRSLNCLGRRNEAAVALRESLLAAGDSSLAKTLDPPLSPARRDAAMRAIFRTRLNQDLERRRERWRPSTARMVLYAELGNRDSTLMWLDSMYVERALMLYVVPFDPLMDFIRDDPRFDAFLRRLPWIADSARGRFQSRLESVVPTP
jgi:tetratricopeptide (TPR) repeat protein